MVRDEASSAMTQWRLASMMLVMFAPLSCWFVTIGTYIGQHTGPNQMFSVGFVGTAYATLALASLCSPFLMGVIADKWVSPNRLIVLSHVLCGSILWHLVSVRDQTAFWFTMLAYAVCFSPMMGLANAVCFRHLADPEKSYPRIRMCGTISWIMGSWLVGYAAPMWYGKPIESTVHPLEIAAVVHLIAAVAGWWIPATPPLMVESNPTSVRTSMSGAAIRIMFRSDLRMEVIAVLLLAICIPFYVNFANLFLNDMGVPRAAGHLAWGQVVEIPCIMLLPAGLLWLGTRRALLLGGVAWMTRYILFAFAASTSAAWLYWPAILLHGVGYTFSFLTLQIVVDRKSPPELKATVQGFLFVILNGIGALIGTQLTSVCQILFLSGKTAEMVGWQAVWWVAAGLAAVPVLLLWMSLWRSPSRSE